MRAGLPSPRRRHRPPARRDPGGTVLGGRALLDL